jgi:hypothetical protein
VPLRRGGQAYGTIINAGIPCSPENPKILR